MSVLGCSSAGSPGRKSNFRVYSGRVLEAVGLHSSAGPPWKHTPPYVCVAGAPACHRSASRGCSGPRAPGRYTQMSALAIRTDPGGLHGGTEDSDLMRSSDGTVQRGCLPTWEPGSTFHYGEVACLFIYGSQACQHNRVVSERKNDEDPWTRRRPCWIVHQPSQSARQLRLTTVRLRGKRHALHR